MSIAAKLCRWIASHMNLHVIPDRTNPEDTYIARYHTADDQKNARWFLHNIQRGDHEEWSHNHPYKWQFSLILSASYEEEYFEVKGEEPFQWRTNIKKRRVRFFNWIPGSRFHRITKLNGEVWTLFIHGPKHGDSWGFWWDGVGYIHNELMARYLEWQNRKQARSSESSLPN